MLKTIFPDKGLPREQFRQLSLARRSSFMFRRAVRFGAEGTLIGLPVTAFAMAASDTGEVIPTGAASLAGFAAYPVFQATIAAGLMLIPGVGQGVALGASMILAMYPSTVFENGVHRGLRTFSQFGRQVLRLETGGGFYDTPSAQRLRQQAVQEMSAALAPARRYLGQEARLMHR